MGVADRSRAHVEAVLDALETSYDEFPVNQTSVTVPSRQFERVSERCRQGTARIDVHVRNERGDVLVVGGDGQPAVPSAIVDPRQSVTERARAAVRAGADVEFAVDGLLEVTIAGVRDERAPQERPLYRLIALLAGQHVTGEPGPGADWTPEPPTPALLR
jgi:hypothetical protein